jgi:Tol biopolymer transport system component/DNA-binding winged helix-turn-helix (wHTH) protein
MTSNDSNRARFGPFEVDLHTHELWKFGTRLKLVGQPFDILQVMLCKAGELVTREELHTRLWPADTFVDFNHGLNAAVNKLREALSDSAENPRYIETLPRRGYRFIAEVEWIQPQTVTQPAPQPKQSIAEAQLGPIAPPTSVQPELAPVAPPVVAQREASSSRHLSRYLIGAGALFTILLIIAFAVRSNNDAQNSGHGPVEHTRPLFSVANTNTPAFSPDGNSVAFYLSRSSAAGLYRAEVGSDQLVQLTRSDDGCCPVWSPDGRWIAFAHSANDEVSIHVVAADGGNSQKQQAETAALAQPAAFRTSSTNSTDRILDTGGIHPSRGEIDWSPDGKSIAFAGPAGISLVSLENSTVRRISEPTPGSQDWGPVFSPDGRSVMFVRTCQVTAPDSIWIAPAAGGEAHMVLSEPGRIASPAQWSFDGRSVIYSSNHTGHPALFRASLDAPNSPTEMVEAGSPAWDPAIARHGYRLAYQRLLRSLSIWQMDLTESGEKKPYLSVSSTSDTDQGPGPQFSPDGQKLAYMSDRSGTMEIWIANRDGSNPFQLSAVGGAGTPRWSPDSQAIVFDVATTNGSKIVSMNLHGGAPQNLTPDGFHSVCPSWSRDGKWIYFGSTRNSRWQVWKVPSNGGPPVQVTQQGGHAALESVDGKFLYYSKTPDTEPEIWRLNFETGEEKLLTLVHPGSWASWQVVNNGILFVGPSLGHQAVLSFYDPAKQRTSTISILERAPFWLGATLDAKLVAFDQPGREQAQTMLVENFR